MFGCVLSLTERLSGRCKGEQPEKKYEGPPFEVNPSLSLYMYIYIYIYVYAYPASPAELPNMKLFHAASNKLAEQEM